MSKLGSTAASAKFCIILVCFSVFIDLCLFLSLPSGAEFRRLVSSLNPFVILGVIFSVMALAAGVLEILTPHSGLKRRALGVLLLLTLIPSYRMFQLYTDLGVFILNGSEHWIAQAANTSDPSEGKRYLGVVLSATQYGVNEAENQILDNYAPTDQARLFALLSEIAPNKNWQKRYLARSRAAAGLSMSIVK